MFVNNKVYGSHLNKATVLVERTYCFAAFSQLQVISAVHQWLQLVSECYHTQGLAWKRVG